MKDIMMKLAGVKTEEEFYKKFPTEESFMAKHGKALKKAQRGAIAYRETMQPISPMQPLGAVKPDVGPLRTGATPTIGKGGMAEFLGRQEENIGGYLQAGSDIVEGISMIGKQKKAIQAAKQEAALTELQARAASIKPNNIERRYLTPWDDVQSNEAFINSLGTGTEVLAKQGKKVRKAQYGNEIDPMAQFSQTLQRTIVNGGRGEDAGSKIGGGIGRAVGTVFGGPIGGEIGDFVLSTIGGFLDTSDTKIGKYNNQSDRNVGNIMFNTSGMDISKFAKTGTKVAMDGDLIVHNGSATPLSYNPYMPGGGETVQLNGPSHTDGGVLTSFGGSMVEGEGKETMTKLGDQAIFTGKIKVSKEMENILGIPGTAGKTFNTINKEYSKKESKLNKAKTKAIEELSDITIDKSDPGFAARKLTAMGSDMKLKSIAEDKLNLFSLQEAYNQTADEMGLDAAELAKGKIKMAKNGIKAQNGKTTDKKLTYSEWLNGRPSSAYNQNLYKDYSEEYDRSQAYNTALGKRKTEEEERVRKAIREDEVTKRKQELEDIWLRYRMYSGSRADFKTWYQQIHRYGQRGAWKDDYKQWYDSEYPAKNTPPKKVTPSQSGIAEVSDEELAKISGTQASSTKKGKTKKATEKDTRTDIPLMKPLGPPSQIEIDENPELIPISEHEQYLGGAENTTGARRRENNNLEKGMMALNTILPYLRPSDVERLDPRQIAGELHALATDKVESVPAQLYHPQLMTPQDVSLQDMLNENRAGYRATERLARNNPAALSILNAQRYGADQKVLAEQFRLNQAERNRVYSGNTETLNNAQMQNLQILDNQMVRQEQAKSNTKETIQNALNSISSKYLQNQLENRRLATYENLYNYRYGKDFRTDNYNPLQIFDTDAGEIEPIDFASGREPVYVKENGEEKVIGTRKVPKRGNGSIVKAIKDL